MVSSKRQQGVVLIVALVFLVSLTAVASVLMLNTTTDIKMSGASEEKVIATQEAISAVNETIADQVTSGTNLFVNGDYPIDVDSVNSVTVTDVILTKDNLIPVLCTHSELPSDDNIMCDMLTIDVNNRYGKGQSSSVNVEAGIVQQVLDL